MVPTLDLHHCVPHSDWKSDDATPWLKALVGIRLLPSCGRWSPKGSHPSPSFQRLSHRSCFNHADPFSVPCNCRALVSLGISTHVSFWQEFFLLMIGLSSSHLFMFQENFQTSRVRRFLPVYLKFYIVVIIGIIHWIFLHFFHLSTLWCYTSSLSSNLNMTMWLALHNET